MKEILDEHLLPEDKEPTKGEKELDQGINIFTGIQLANACVLILMAWTTIEGSIVASGLVFFLGAIISASALWLKEKEAAIYGIAHTSISLMGLVASYLAGWWDNIEGPIPVYLSISVTITIYGLATFVSGVWLLRHRARKTSIHHEGNTGR